MDNTMNLDRQLLSDLYRNMDEAVNMIDTILPNSNTPEQKSRLNHIETKLRQSQQKIVTAVIRDVVAELPSNQSKDKSILSLAQAIAFIEEIEKKAKQRNLKVVIAVFNSSANPIAVHCMDDAYIASYDIAFNKAYTSAALKMSTMTLKSLSQPGQELYGIQHTNQGRIVIFGGGEPLYYKNKLVGAIGVSGGTEQEDALLAEYGKDIIEEVMKW